MALSVHGKVQVLTDYDVRTMFAGASAFPITKAGDDAPRLLSLVKNPGY